MNRKTYDIIRVAFYAWFGFLMFMMCYRGMQGKYWMVWFYLGLAAFHFWFSIRIWELQIKRPKY